MPREKTIDEGHVKFVCAIIQIIIIAVIATMHWYRVVAFSLSNFDLTLTTYGYYALLFLSSYFTFYLGLIMTKGIIKQKVYKKAAKKAELSYLSAAKKGIFNIDPAKPTVKKDIEKTKQKTGVEPHRLIALIVAVGLIAAIAYVEWFMLVNYMWREYNRLWSIYLWSIGYIAIVHITGFTLGAITIVPPSRNRPRNAVMR